MLFNRISGILLLGSLVCGCQWTGSPLTPNPLAPSAAPGTTEGLPYRGTAAWTVTSVQWAGVPGQATSLFGGRCSVPSDYVISATWEGDATILGHFTGETSHCSQVTWSPQGPVGATYSDGRYTQTSATGSTLYGAYGNGTSGVDSATGETWFADTFTIQGGTGPFDGAAGTGQEGGRFSDLNAVLGGTPVAMWQEGRMSYHPGRGGGQ